MTDLTPLSEPEATRIAEAYRDGWPAVVDAINDVLGGRREAAAAAVSARDGASIALIAAGTCLAGAAGFGYGGWVGGCAVLAALFLALGLLLGYGDPEQATGSLTEAERGDAGGEAGDA